MDRLIKLTLLVTIFISVCFHVSSVSAQDDDREVCDDLRVSGIYVTAANCYLSLNPCDYWWAADSYGWAGNVAYEMGDYGGALHYYILEMRYFDRTSDSDRRGSAYYHAGTATYQLSMYGNAEEYFSRSAYYHERASNHRRTGISFDWAGNSAIAQKKYSEGIYYFRSAAESFIDVPDHKSTGDCYAKAGDAALAMEDCEQAKVYWYFAKQYYNLTGYEWKMPLCGCDFSTQPPIERCFGGIGVQCRGFPLPFLKNKKTCYVLGWISAGSILHDQCCVSTNNTGFRCANPDGSDKCKEYWDLAVGDFFCARIWTHKFGPYPDGNDGDKDRNLRVPAGKLVHSDYQFLCQAGTCQEITEDTPCRYCICK